MLRRSAADHISRRASRRAPRGLLLAAQLPRVGVGRAAMARAIGRGAAAFSPREPGLEVVKRPAAPPFCNGWSITPRGQAKLAEIAVADHKATVVQLPTKLLSRQKRR